MMIQMGAALALLGEASFSFQLARLTCDAISCVSWRLDYNSCVD